MSHFWTFVLLALVTWRLTSLLVDERGPFDVLTHVRRWLRRRVVVGDAFDCFFCASVWVAAPLALALDGPWLLHWLALSGAACLAEQATRR
jgi:hypothetical protein